jgi:hypothetical protein
MNDYRTLLLHISQMNVSVLPDDQGEEGYRVLKECLAAANALMASSYSPTPPPSNASSEEAEKMQLRRYFLCPSYSPLRIITHDQQGHT